MKDSRRSSTPITPTRLRLRRLLLSSLHPHRGNSRAKDDVHHHHLPRHHHRFRRRSIRHHCNNGMKRVMMVMAVTLFRCIVTRSSVGLVIVVIVLVMGKRKINGGAEWTRMHLRLVLHSIPMPIRIVLLLLLLHIIVYFPPLFPLRHPPSPYWPRPPFRFIVPLSLSRLITVSPCLRLSLRRL